MIYKAAIFDMDGTLVDTLADLADSVNAMLEHYKFPARSIDEVRQFVGNGARKLIERSLPPEKSGDAGFFVRFHKDFLSDGRIIFPARPCNLRPGRYNINFETKRTEDNYLWTKSEWRYMCTIHLKGRKLYRSSTKR